jgi:hypothetical protein
VGERALGATVDQLLQVAHEALDRGDSSAGAIALGAAECEAEVAATVLAQLQASLATFRCAGQGCLPFV